MNEKYLPAEVEAAAQADWAARDAYRVTEDANKPKFYACSMLPYPSGKLHMGHVRNYTINDMLARYKRMQGFNVLMPMGWDAFGLPAENAAMKSNVAPAAWTVENIRAMKAQCQALGLAFDWSRELSTCDPAYYKWNQWFFLKMLEQGIAYRKTQVVNWDPVDQTVLANEQVIDGHGWRSGAPVEKREIPGYYLSITKYAEELLDFTLHKLPGWSDRLRLIQENWLGKSEGVRFAFTHDIRGEDRELIQDGRMHVFTTRADTIMGVTFCAVAPEHPLAQHAAKQDPKVAAFIERCQQGGTTEAELATRDKEGVPTGLTVTHPLTEEPIPLWVGNYVLMTYGDGAVMGVPGHDERDFAFALKYHLPILQVVHIDGEHYDYHRWQDWYADKTRGVTINSDLYSGLDYPHAVNAVARALSSHGLGERKTTWRLRDWSISRQRYWGTPIPIVHCDACGVVPVPEKDLPVVLPDDLVPDGSGSPLAKCESFLRVACPTCGAPARRETDTMDTFVDSAWYYMRYCSPDASTMVDARNDYWMPMDQYIGGIEHAVLHLLYARFWTKVMRDMGLLHFDEPFARLMNHGMLLNYIYYTRGDKGGKDYVPPTEVKPVLDAQGRIIGGTRADGTPVEYGGVGKMGKTERNGVDPQALIDQYGADTARLFVMFVGGPEDASVWSDTGVEGSSRFLRRFWASAKRNQQPIKGVGGAAVVPSELSAKYKDLRREFHTVLKQATYDYERMQYNTVVSAAMKMLNVAEQIDPLEPRQVASDGRFARASDSNSALLAEMFGILLRVLYPACPHITHVLWQDLGYAQRLGDLLDAPMPAVEEAALVQDRMELVLQVNGKLRGSIIVAADADDKHIEMAAIASPEFAKFAGGRSPRFVKIVKGRLVNLVV